MDTSFYTGIRGVKTQQERMNVISNNIANVNTYGYKTKNSSFQDMLYYNQRDRAGEVTNLTAGTGALHSHITTDFSGSGFHVSGGALDFAINGEGFFKLQDPQTGEVTYTRNGHFGQSRRSDGFYLVTDSGKFVVDSQGQPIRVNQGELSRQPAVYDFANTDGMLSIGNNEFAPVEKNGNATLVVDAQLVNGYLEMSNVDLAKEMADTIEASRAYSYVLKMVQTADEVEQTINELRG
ncbi:flagellar basal-body rod protein FlgG [Lachnospiraceae bacterium PF1-21]|uniref:Flagellar hook-basal body protein n=1 Tax=Ohessyouella blattaphilus TaxID=2949333 RepID=A0ABT1EEK7_9FIRM|nr:flagellar hook-basal body protein [Ohessyouella blattaphilus]MCP1109139.1 flagellar hook-basal body protein [Ohessyouella blattaphilus]MCR8562533.1 flagellar hook-basal body protein [Ohessyouella blattaphilus]MDL2250241.1 flagellar hook-basal body protein [Lachnospiraceae bacterium OttesenSCG-928-J05]